LGDGSYEFYIRAADWARINWLVKFISPISGQSATETFYQITDQAWINLITNIIDLINDPNHGGAIDFLEIVESHNNVNYISPPIKTIHKISFQI